MFINDQNSFDRWLLQFNPDFYVGIDTEFVRQNTFFPILSLFQISSITQTVVIDPLSVDITSLLKKLNDNASVIKIFFSGRQDLEAIFHQFGILLHPVFDLQIACDFLDYREHVSFAEVVLEICYEMIDKDQQKIDWSYRPLSAEAIQYAYNDAHYLIPIFKMLKKKLKMRHRYAWILEESSKLLDQIMDQGESYFEKKIFNPLSSCSSLQREMVLWRERYARFKNTPRKMIFSDMTVHIIKPKKLFWSPEIGQDFIHSLTPFAMLNFRKYMKLLFKIAKKYNIPKRYFFYPYDIINLIQNPFEKNIFLEGWRYYVLHTEGVI